MTDFAFSAGAEPQKSVEECASLFAYAMAAAAAIASMTTGVTGGDPSATGNNVPIESIPDVLSMGEAIERSEPSEFGTYAWNKAQDFIQKHTKEKKPEGWDQLKYFSAKLGGTFHPVKGLTLSELNDALKEEGFDIEISEDVFHRFDNGYYGSADAVASGSFMDPDFVHDGLLSADELGHMYDDYVGDELVVKVDKKTGKHTLDISDEYREQAIQDSIDVAERKEKMEKEAELRKLYRQTKIAKEKFENEEKEKEKKEAEAAKVVGLAVGGFVASAAAATAYQKKELEKLEKEKEKLEARIRQLLRLVPRQPNRPQPDAAARAAGNFPEFKLRF